MTFAHTPLIVGRTAATRGAVYRFERFSCLRDRIVFTRLRVDPRTQDYYARRIKWRVSR